MKLPSKSSLIKAAVALVLFSSLAGGTVYGSFVAQVQNSGNEFSARDDLLPPEIYGGTTEKYQGGITGWVGASRSMYSYARVDDMGHPPIGLDLVQSKIGSPSYDVDLSVGNWTVGGSSYNYRTPRTTVPADRLVSGTNPMSIYARDNYGQSSTVGGFNFRYDPVAPTPEDVLIENGPGTEFVPDKGDKLTYTLDEPADPSSLIGDWEVAPDQRFLANWNGSEREVTVVFQSPLEYGTDPKGSNRIRIYDGSGPTTINLGRLDVWSNNWGVDCEATFNDSSMEMKPGNEAVVVTLGDLDVPGSIITPAPITPEECS